MPEACHNYPFQALRPVPILPALLYQLPYLWLWLEPAQPRSEPCADSRWSPCRLLPSQLLPAVFFLLPFPSRSALQSQHRHTDISSRPVQSRPFLRARSRSPPDALQAPTFRKPLRYMPSQAIHTSGYVHDNTHRTSLPSLRSA